MHICFFNRSYWPDQAATGQFLTELAEDLVAHHGCRVTVVAGRPLHGSGRSSARGWPVADETHNGVEIRRAHGTCFQSRRFAGRAANYLTYVLSAELAARQIGYADVVVSLTDPPIIGLTAARVARRTGARFVFLCEDIFPEVAALLDDFHNERVNQALDRVNRRLIGSADAIVALGECMRARLVTEKGADPQRVRVIHNWADCDAILPGDKDNAFSREHGLADRFVVMHSGNIGMSQNLDALVGAAELLRANDRIVFAIVGDGARRLELERQVAAKELTNVRFVPYQPKARLQESFAAADVFVVSLKAGIEGYIVPSKVYGILAAGRPFIAATDPACEAASIARDHRCGVEAPPGDPIALAERITALHESPDSLRLMGENARRAAWQFDRRVAVQAYFDLLTSVARLDRAA